MYNLDFLVSVRLIGLVSIKEAIELLEKEVVPALSRKGAPKIFAQYEILDEEIEPGDEDDEAILVPDNSYYEDIPACDYRSVFKDGKKLELADIPEGDFLPAIFIYEDENEQFTVLNLEANNAGLYKVHCRQIDVDRRNIPRLIEMLKKIDSIKDVKYPEYYPSK